jgi:hypothetical protein
MNTWVMTPTRIIRTRRKHPGVAFMEMQFYPPGWITSNSATQWTAALNIDSLSQNGNTGQGNNAACGGAIEYVNYAFIQTDGVPPGPPNPLLQNGSTFTANANTLYMNPGDELLVTEVDTAHGLKITVTDLTTGQSGFMVASAANGFGQILFDPNGTSCDPATHNPPYDFHPMYATSSEHTRVPWAAHSYNIAFSDEIGYFEYCNTVAGEGANPADPHPGVGCVNPAVGADFYPIFTTTYTEHGCRWQEGGPFLPAITQNFGGTSSAEYGPLLLLTYPGTNGAPSYRYNDFRRILPFNPCPAPGT